ncbi:hypothetical protein RRF57_010635 [Xylaria bambusicola]|uniref:D-isomer specific 2-hydroxyacid dehydrogenase NAD-binding domain-containing protein n=1 Tax=Xylaria bambusicola TaxID=326684 RepID=A0AAN7UWX4_9PEZI
MRERTPFPAERKSNLPYLFCFHLSSVQNALARSNDTRLIFNLGVTNRLPNLKLLLTTGPRNAAIDVQALQARNIPVAGSSGSGGGRGTPSGPDSTTQHTVALILALARNIPQDDATVKSGGWQTKHAMGLAGKTFGTVGLGRLGASTSRIMHLAFGMRVIAWSANLTQDAADEKAKAMDCR